MKMVAALVGAAALLVPAAAAPDAAPYTIVGGTWISGWQGSFLGPSWWLDGPTQSYGVTMVGPDGFTKHIGGPNQRLSIMPTTRSVYWCNTTCGEKSPGGAWYAIGDGDHTKVNFTIDQTSRLTPVQVTLYSGDENSFTASWNDVPGAQSFMVYVQDEGATSAFDWIVGKMLPAGSTTVTFTNMGLNPEWAYEFVVFAFTGDITSTTAPSVFNIASTRIDFLPGVLSKLGPQTGEPHYSCYGSMDGALTPCSSHGGVAHLSAGFADVVASSAHSCGVQGSWSVSINGLTTCGVAQTVFHAYVSNNKCSTNGKASSLCSVKSYRCVYAKAGAKKSVGCMSSKGFVGFKARV